MMRVYLVRHGFAADGSGYDGDEDRPLTDEGRRRLRLTAATWTTLPDPVPERWLVSPYVRAVQTAEFLVASFAASASGAALNGVSSETPPTAVAVQISRDFVPEALVSRAADRIREESAAAIAVVAHQPLLGGLAAFLLGWPSVPAQVQPGAILAIDLPDDGPGELAWHLSAPSGVEGPKLLIPEGA